MPPEPYLRRLKAPFCCTPCEKKHRLCAFQKSFYHAQPALVEAREGMPLNRESFYKMDAIIVGQMKKGLRLYHISQTQNLGVSTAVV